MMLNTKDYWNSRLTLNYNLLGVGDISLGLKYNELLYRVRKFVFDRVLRKIGLDKSTCVLDIGSGPGFYIERWKEKGIRNLTGFDISIKAINELSNKFPEFQFHQLDISDELTVEFKKTQFNYISAFDVLFHIIDNEKYTAAIRNISELLKPGGYFIYSDNFMNKEFRIEHQVCRKYDFVIKTLKENNLELVRKRPMFILMNNPIKSKSKFLKKLWNINANIIRKNNFLSNILSYTLFPIEILLVKFIHVGPSTEILVLRKR